MSAQENIDKRNAIRSTWGKNLLLNENLDIKLLFIIGKYQCPIHPSQRVSVYGCEKWNYNYSGGDMDLKFFITV